MSKELDKWKRPKTDTKYEKYQKERDESLGRRTTRFGYKAQTKMIVRRAYDYANSVKTNAEHLAQAAKEMLIAELAEEYEYMERKERLVEHHLQEVIDAWGELNRIKVELEDVATVMMDDRHHIVETEGGLTTFSAEHPYIANDAEFEDLLSTWDEWDRKTFKQEIKSLKKFCKQVRKEQKKEEE